MASIKLFSRLRYKIYNWNLSLLLI